MVEMSLSRDAIKPPANVVAACRSHANHPLGRGHHRRLGRDNELVDGAFVVRLVVHG